MKVPVVLSALLALVLASLPTGAAEQAAPLAPVAGADCLALAAAPPCGYIVPQLSLDFPGKPACRAATLGGAIDLTKCIQLPADGGSHVEEGFLRLSWDITQDGTYPPDATCIPPGTACITVSFSGTASNPKWMSVDIEPAQVVLEAADFANPEYLKVNQENQQVMFLLEVPLKVTFTRTGAGDDDKSIQRIERSQGAVQVFVKAKSSANGQYYKEAFGVEEFRFDPCRNGDALTGEVRQCSATASSDGAGGKDAPGLGLAALLGALVIVGAVLRRRA